MPKMIDPAEILRLGFEWPKYPTIEQRLTSTADPIDLSALIQSLQSDLEYYDQLLQDGFTFKQQHGADYADITDRHDEYLAKHRTLQQAVRYLEEIERTLTS